VYIYGSYRKIKAGVGLSLFGLPCICYRTICNEIDRH